MPIAMKVTFIPFRNEICYTIQYNTVQEKGLICNEVDAMNDMGHNDFYEVIIRIETVKNRAFSKVVDSLII